MCTLILGREVLGPRTVVLGANRDERVARPSAPPGVLLEEPRLVGGRDLEAGGTWLALREGTAAVALLNRRDAAPAPPGTRRSRGQLTLDVAGASRAPFAPSAHREITTRDELALAALERALAAIGTDRYAPFTLLYASARACWWMAFDGDRPTLGELAPGWHVLTHADVDDRSEPRTAHLLDRLRETRPASAAVAEALIVELLRSHGENGTPPVCLHQGRMVTVSSSLIWMDERRARYWHAEGRPCERDFADMTPLIRGASQPGGRA